MVLSNSQTTYASLHCSGQWLHAKLLSALFKTSNVKPMKSLALISRFYLFSYGSLDLRWNGFLAIGTMKVLHWKLKEFFFVLFSKVPNLPFVPQWLQSLAPRDKSGIRMSACKLQVFMLQNKYPAERKSSQSWSFSLAGVQCHNIVPTHRHKASVFSQAQTPGHGLWSDKAPALSPSVPPISLKTHRSQSLKACL